MLDNYVSSDDCNGEEINKSKNGKVNTTLAVS